MTAAAPIASPGVDGQAAGRSLHSLYERYARQIFSYCLRRLGSREDAEDALQTTFMNAFRGLSRGVTPHAEQAWLFAIAQNVCNERQATSWRRRRVECDADFEVLEDVVPSRDRRGDELIGLTDVLASMPASQRRAILLREWQGLSYREIGQELELSQAAVETLIFRARRSLAKGLEQPLKKRLATGLNLGPLLATLKALFTGGAAVKAAAVLVAAGTATVVATKAERTIVHRQHAQPGAGVTHARPAPAPAVRRASATPAPARHRAPKPAAARKHAAAAPARTDAVPAAPAAAAAAVVRRATPVHPAPPPQRAAAAAHTQRGNSAAARAAQPAPAGSRPAAATEHGRPADPGSQAAAPVTPQPPASAEHGNGKDKVK